jgi:hypothetical protein
VGESQPTCQELTSLNQPVPFTLLTELSSYGDANEYKTVSPYVMRTENFTVVFIVVIIMMPGTLPPRGR